MTIRPNLKSVLLVLVAVLAVVLVAGFNMRSAARQERLLHDSQKIDAMLAERESSYP